MRQSSEIRQPNQQESAWVVFRPYVSSLMVGFFIRPLIHSFTHSRIHTFTHPFIPVPGLCPLLERIQVLYAGKHHVEFDGRRYLVLDAAAHRGGGGPAKGIESDCWRVVRRGVEVYMYAGGAEMCEAAGCGVVCVREGGCER